LEEGNTFGDGESRGPLIAKNIKTDTSVAIDIGMINACREVYLRREYQYPVSSKEERTRTRDCSEGLLLLGVCTFGGLKG